MHDKISKAVIYSIPSTENKLIEIPTHALLIDVLTEELCL